MICDPEPILEMPMGLPSRSLMLSYGASLPQTTAQLRGVDTYEPTSLKCFAPSERHNHVSMRDSLVTWGKRTGNAGDQGFSQGNCDVDGAILKRSHHLSSAYAQALALPEMTLPRA